MKVYFGFDETDNHDSLYGTGKLVRWFKKELPEGCQCLGVVRQQLFVCDTIPYTSHNSAACMILNVADPSQLDHIIEDAITHIKHNAALGSDPGLCVVAETDPTLDDIVDYGRFCSHAVSTQRQALQAARKVHLSGHGGTNDGIIGATAAVGLTHWGWSGRFIDLGNLRDWPERTTVSRLRECGIETVSMDRETTIPGPDDTILTNGWLRPRLMGHRPVLFVMPKGQSVWENMYRKRRKKEHLTELNEHLGTAN